MNTTTKRAEHLTTVWREALRIQQLTGTDRADAAEQEAYDELIDFIEDNDLNYSDYDPR